MDITLVVLIHTSNTMVQYAVSLAMLVTCSLARQGGSAWKTRPGVDSQHLVEVRNTLTFLTIVEGAVIYKFKPSFVCSESREQQGIYAEC